LDYRGFVVEGPGENIFIVKNKKLFTPKLGNILHGITRNSIIKIAKDLKIKVIEKDNKEIGEITKNLQDRFYKIINGEDKKYQNWFTYLN
jgi:branched-chain amino acid aminotransferase